MAWKIKADKKASAVMALRIQVQALHQEKMAYATIVALLIHARGGHLFIPESDLKALPACTIDKRFDQAMDGWDFKLDYSHPAPVPEKALDNAG